MGQTGQQIRFEVRGVPRGQQRGRHVAGRVVSTTDKRLKLWRCAIEREARAACEAHGWPAWVAGAVRVDWEATFPTKDATRWGKTHTAKPDRDNVDKALLDAMEKAKVLAKGDQRVGAGTVRKAWGQHGGLVVVISAAVDQQVAASVDALMPDWLAG